MPFICGKVHLQNIRHVSRRGEFVVDWINDAAAITFDRATLIEIRHKQKYHSCDNERKQSDNRVSVERR